MTIDEMIEVLQAYKDGKAIEFCKKGVCDWILNISPTFNFEHFNYRVKPEPREFWLGLSSNGSIVATGKTKKSVENWGTSIKVREVIE